MLAIHLTNNPFFDKDAADREVTDSLYRTIRRLEKMPKLLRLSDGRVVRVIGDIEEVSNEELQAIHNELLREADNVSAFIVPESAEEATPQEETIELPATESVEVVEAVAVPEQPAEAVAVETPVEQVAEAPAAPEQVVAQAVETPAPVEEVPAPQVTVDAPVIQ